MIDDLIERQLVLKSTRERVWAALTEAGQLARWFSSEAEVDLRPGGKIRFYWEQYADGADGEIDVVEPQRRFAYRWHPFNHINDMEVDPELYTRVEFLIEDHPHGVRLTLRESGFASLPEVLQRRAYPDNELGWTEELSDLRDLLGGESA